ncbi:MAG: FAD:protein FMN transferase [Bacteroidota bacterium]|nr:FAD:protein FMN transferase [Bacteroidota bacterium]
MEIFHKTIPCMNSCIDLVLPEMNDVAGGELALKIEKEALALEKLLSRFDSQAEVFRVNEAAFREEIPVSDRLWKILQDCFRFNEWTSGYFDIGLGYFKNPVKRNQGSLDCGMKDIILNPERKSIKFSTDTVSLDFGAIGKGLVLRETEKILTSFSVKDCFISFGGSSVLTRGTHPYGPNWPLSMRNISGSMPVFYLNDSCVSFSGALTENILGNKYHIVNPKNLQIEENNRISFVQCSCPVIAEVLSTTLLLVNLQEADAIVAKFNPLKALVFNKNVNKEISIIYSYGHTD